MVENTDPFNDDNKDVKHLPPDYTLKNMIGEDVDLKEVFTEEVVEKAQQSIDKHQDEFLEWATSDLASLNTHYQKAADNPSARTSEIAAIEEIAHRLKSQAGTFKYELATHIAKSLAGFCSRHPNPQAGHLVVVRKHIDTLAVIFARRIRDDGGATGKELVENMVRLVEKYNQ